MSSVVARTEAIARFAWRSGRRAVIVLAGTSLLLGGLAMLVLPGPGLFVIIAGLAVLAREFVWAERALDKAKSRAKASTDALRRAARR
jgi:tellurite resistance protein TerC